MSEASPTQLLHWPSVRVLLTGGAGFLGSAVARALAARGVPSDRIFITRSREHDLTRREHAERAVHAAFERCTGNDTPIVIHCAAAVGGIAANKSQPARFFHDNMAMALNLIEACRAAGFHAGGRFSGGRFVQVGSMTSYPAPQPGTAVRPYIEEDLWRGYPDAASAPYAIAKLAAWQMLDAYHRQHQMHGAYVIPVNLYGPGDNIADVANAHVAGSLVKRFVDAVHDGADEVICWGSGTPTRDFLYIDDAAEGVVRAAERMTTPTPINLGSGMEVAIKDLASMIAEAAGYSGRITWDTSKPDGQMRRSLDASRAATLLDWRATTPIDRGLRHTVEWYRSTLTRTSFEPEE